MGFIDEWQRETEDFFIEFIDSNVDVGKVIELSCKLGMLSTYELSYAPMSAEKIIFLYGSEDKNYTIDEVSYMQFGNTVMELHQTDDSYNSLFYIELSDCDYDRDLIACALIKIFNKAFNGKNIFCFKDKKNIAFGCMQEPITSKGDFALSKWFSSNQSEEIFELTNCADGDLNELIYLIVESSSLQTRIRTYEKEKFDIEYVKVLQDIMFIYQIDLQKEIEEYQNSFFQTDHVINRYNDIVDILIDIGISELSSYAFLEKAEKAESISKARLLAEQTELSLIDSDTLEKARKIPPGALEDAEKILKYI